jgi:hypothetical protein
LVAGAVLAVAAIAAVVIAITAGGGSSSNSSAKEQLGTAAVPAKKISDFNEAVKAAGCVFTTYPSEGRQHLASDTAVNNNYKTNPPTSGNHNPTPAQDGIYDAGNTPAKESFVHSLEHGRIEIQYRPGTPKRTIDQLVTLFNEKVNGTEGYHTLLFQNNTNMPFAVAATAWTQMLGCKTFNPKVFDAIRSFRSRYVDKAPEFIP